MSKPVSLLFTPTFVYVSLLCLRFLHVFAGGMPGPILFGYALDHSCLLWEKKCDGNTGSCLYYDNHQMALLFLAVCAISKVLNIVCGLLSWRLYVHKHRKLDNAPLTAVEHMLSLEKTGNGQSGSGYGSTENIVDGVHDDQDFAINNPAEQADASQL